MRGPSRRIEWGWPFLLLYHDSPDFVDYQDWISLILNELPIFPYTPRRWRGATRCITIPALIKKCAEKCIFRLQSIFLKKAFSILFFGFLLLHTTGYLLLFQVRKMQIRKEMALRVQEGVPLEELVLLKIPLKSGKPAMEGFQKVEDHEIDLMGLRYDIAREEIRGDTAFYYCIFDEKETLLYAHKREVSEKKWSTDPENQQQREKIQRLLSSLFYLPVSGFSLPAGSIAYGAQPGYFFRIKTWDWPPPGPPPEGYATYLF